jgi:hypothetical protein
MVPALSVKGFQIVQQPVLQLLSCLHDNDNTKSCSCSFETVLLISQEIQNNATSFAHAWTSKRDMIYEEL